LSSEPKLQDSWTVVVVIVSKVDALNGLSPVVTIVNGMHATEMEGPSGRATNRTRPFSIHRDLRCARFVFGSTTRVSGIAPNLFSPFVQPEEADKRQPPHPSSNSPDDRLPLLDLILVSSNINWPALLFFLVSGQLFIARRQPQKRTKPAIDVAAHKNEIQKWQNDRLASLTKDDGWLTLVGLFWFERR